MGLSKILRFKKKKKKKKFIFLKVYVFKKEKLRHGFRLSKKIISLRKILFFYVNVSHFQAMDKNNTLLLG